MKAKKEKKNRYAFCKLFRLAPNDFFGSHLVAVGGLVCSASGILLSHRAISKPSFRLPEKIPKWESSGKKPNFGEVLGSLAGGTGVGQNILTPLPRPVHHPSPSPELTLADPHSGVELIHQIIPPCTLHTGVHAKTFSWCPLLIGCLPLPSCQVTSDSFLRYCQSMVSNIDRSRHLSAPNIVQIPAYRKNQTIDSTSKSPLRRDAHLARTHILLADHCRTRTSEEISPVSNTRAMASACIFALFCGQSAVGTALAPKGKMGINWM